MNPGIKEKILDASYRMFLEKGYVQSTLRAIAGECGITHANILYHFDGKADIAKHIIRKYIEALMRETDEIAQRNAIRPSVSKATLYWVLHLSFLVEYPDFTRVYVEMLRENRNIMAEIIPLGEKSALRNPTVSLFGLQPVEDAKTFIWKMELLTDADYRTIERIGSGEFSLREAMYYMVDLLVMLFSDRKAPRISLERNIVLMLDLISEENLRKIYKESVN